MELKNARFHKTSPEQRFIDIAPDIVYSEILETHENIVQKNAQDPYRILNIGPNLTPFSKIPLSSIKAGVIKATTT